MSDDVRKVVLRDTFGKLVTGSKSISPGRPIENWRTYLRSKTAGGTRIWDILLHLAEGNERTIKLKDGREMTVVPTPEVQMRAAVHLSEMLFGKAVPQHEQLKAENEATDMEAVRAMTTEELEARARRALTRGKEIEEAQLVEAPKKNVLKAR